MNVTNFIWGAALLLTALMAGLYYAYSCSVNPGLGQLADGDYIKAMQSINRAIQNPVFFVGFFGPVVLLPVLVFLVRGNDSKVCIALVVASAVLYIFGSFGVTIFCNVPLNEQLDKVDVASQSTESLKEIAATFKSKWNSWHSVRTMASILSLIALVAGCMVRGK